GKARKVYHDETMMTPDEKLKALPKAKDHLKPGITFEILEATAHRLSDNQAADLLQKARQQ
ncbi:MAG: integrase, partial [Nitrospirae bacterium CG_4_9_14_3_um_filter_51_5]